MFSFRTLGVAVLLAGASLTRPAAAQGRSSVSSLTHVVSVTVPARVKVMVSPVRLVSAGLVPAAVKLVDGSANGLAVRVDANKAWVLSISDRVAGGSKRSRTLWSAPLSPVAGDTTVFIPGGKDGGSDATGPLLLTISAP